VSPVQGAQMVLYLLSVQEVQELTALAGAAGKILKT
jgi:hypothetical protein